MTIEFYEKCGNIIGCPNEGVMFPYSKRTRWNNRVAGPGRYPGIGVVRKFSDRFIVVSFRNPKVHKQFSTEESVYEFLNVLFSDV